jgi:2-polyprenyl-3-methyl-5-hydroxy-6-metoxy-1,4-benzoquinol methylase
MIGEVKNNEEFSKTCLSAWHKNASFWLSTRKINPEIKLFIKNVADKVVENEPLRVVDVGCGSGWLASEIVSNFPGASYCGIDFNDYFIERLKKEETHNDYLLLDFNNPIPTEFTNKYNLVVSCLSLIEMTNLDQVIENYKALTFPGGRIIIVTLNPYFELIRLSANADFLKSDLTMFRSSCKPKFYEKEIVVDHQHSGKTYYGVLHPTENLMGALLKNNIRICDYKELNFISNDSLAPIYVAYSLMV